MSEDIFDKLDSLMNKHRAEGVAMAERPEPAPEAEPDIPVLTEEVPEEALRTSPIPVLTEVVEEGGDPLALPDEPVAEEAPSPVAVMAAEPELPPDPLAGLEQRVMEAVENRIAPRLAGKLDLALGELLEQFRLEIEHMVKDAVASELQQYLDTLGDDRRSPH